MRNLGRILAPWLVRQLRRHWPADLRDLKRPDLILLATTGKGPHDVVGMVSCAEKRPCG
jgi:hypothetical protein